MAASVGNDELASLVVSLSADITRYQKDMAKVVGVTAKAAGDSEKAWTAANNNIVKSSTRATQAIGQSANALRAQTGNLASQFQDIGTQLQSGSSPFTIAIQQGQQIGAVLTQASQSGTSLFAALGSAAASALNPINLITIALITAAGYALQYFTGTKENGADSVKALEKEAASWKDIGEAAEKAGLQQEAAFAKAKEQAAQRQADLAKTQEKIDETLAGLRSLGRDAELMFATLRQMSATTGIAEQGRAIDAAAASFARWDAAVKSGDPEAISKAWGDVGTKIGALNEVMGNTGPMLDLLQLYKDGTPTVNDLNKSLTTTKSVQEGVAKATEDLKKKTDDYNKALKELEDAGSTLTEQEKQIHKLTLVWIDAIASAKDYGEQLKANAALQDALSKLSLDAAAAIGTQSSSTSDYAKIVNRLEGTGKNPLSSATGKFQFIDDTWIAEMTALGLATGKTRQEILNLRDDAEVVDKAFEHFTETNAAGLRNVGIAVNDTSKYMAHLLGLGGAIAVLKADPNSLLSTILKPGAISANKGLLGKPGETAQDLVNTLNAKIGKIRGDVAPTDLQSAIQQSKDHTEAMLAEARAAGQLTDAFDKVAAAKETARVTTELLQAARKDGTEATAEEKAQIDAVAAAAGNAAGQIKGYSDAQKQLKEQTSAAEQAQKRQQQAINAQASALASAATGFVTGFISDLREGKTATEALTNALTKLADQLLEMALNAVFKNLFSGLLGGTGALTGTAGLFSQGGRVGYGGSRRTGMSPFAFAGAPRMAGGGFVGVGPGEYPAILHRGEVVIPAAMVRAAGRAGGSASGDTRVSVGNISVATNVNGSGDVKADSERGRKFGQTVQGMVQAEIAKQSRPGGLLTASGSAGRVGR